VSYEAQLIEDGLCPEVVPVATEDGPSDGRCLLPIADAEVAACVGHAREIREWRGMTELEKLAWERSHDDDRFMV